MSLFTQHESVFYHLPSSEQKSSKIAGFDLDWTLTYNEKHLFAKEQDDIFIFPNRKDVLEKLIDEGYTIVIFTNQFAKSKKEKIKKVERITTFIEKLNLPIYIFISTEKDSYRKPCVGMWTLFRSMHKENITSVFYVGDALGRPEDFSDSDKVFAENINAEIKSPEDFFGISEVPTSFQEQKELIVFVGMPGCGKSTYYSNYLKDHVHIEQDKIGSRPKLLKELDRFLLTSKSIVIDSTNPKQENRLEYYEKAQKYGYSIKVLYFLKNGTGFNKLREKPVPDIVYHIYFKNLDPPNTENTPGEVIFIY
jgi:bifunctional polynucleotide phosphatase/kinase